MSLVKKLFANPFLKKIVFSYNWALICAIIAALLFCLLIFLIIKRKKNEKNTKEPEIEEEEKEFLSPVSLLQIWKTFLKNIPAKFRRSILMYQPYIVMGEAGTGKTRLIDNYTDWKNQANQFYPSHTQDELLQIYLGTRIIVQEISASLLHDTSIHARKALENLWKIFKRKKDLIVVITLKGDELIHGDPDLLREQAQIIRGKVNILSEIIKRPLKIRIALTFMNQIKGFCEFSAFMRSNNLPFELTKDQLSDVDNLKNAMGPYEQYFPNALISEEPEDYLKILAFCQNAPYILSSLAGFIKVFTAPDPLSPSPEIDSAFFTSDIINEDNVLSNPFKTRVPIKKVRTYNPMRKHKIAALLLVIIGASYMLFSYYYKQNYIRQVEADLNRINSFIVQKGDEHSGRVLGSNYALGAQSVYNSSPNINLGAQAAPANHNKAILYPIFSRADKFPGSEGKLNYKIYIRTAKFLDKLDKQSKDSLNNMLIVDFFPNAQKQIHDSIMSAKKNLKAKIIKTIFKPKLVPISAQKDAYHKNLMILSLIYASKTNELGRTINKNIQLWAKSCDLDPDIIRTYLVLSDKSWNQTISVNKFIGNSLPANTNRYVSWLMFLQNLNKIIHDSFISPDTLTELKKNAAKIMVEINDSLKESWFDKLRRLIGRETILGNAVIPVWDSSKALNKQDYASFEKFLRFFSTLEINFPSAKDITLGQLLENLRVMMKLKNPDTRNFSFIINKQKFYFTSDELYDLIKTSSMAMLLRNYISYYGRFPGMSFFRQNQEYKDLIVDISSDGNFYFSKRAVIDGRYTKKVYDREVKPVLKALPDLLSKLPISKTDKTHFANFIFREIDAYITNYISTYEDYYKSFRISADSVGELRYILTQMTLPMNQFQEFLIILNNNLSLDCGENPYFNLIKSRLRPLRFISLLMQAQKDAFPELEKYKAILRQFLNDLVSTDAPPIEDGSDAAGILKSKLPPVARIALDIFLNGPDSYLRMIEKWGTSVGIPEQWLYPFTEPVYQAYLLGQKKIEKTIKREWAVLKADYVSPVIDKFPFNPDATSFVTPEDLKNLACSTGEFWKQFSGYIAPLCKKRPDGKWYEKSFVMSSPSLPPNMLKEVNYISQLSGTFFDNKGKPIPLVFEIKPHTLPLIQHRMILVVLSYVRTGKTSVFGFNQQPAWHKFPIEWWKPNTSSAGVEFMRRGKSSRKMFASITVQNSYWSFYRLLKRADTPEPMTWEWEIKSPGGIQWKRKISFSIRQNPWSIFKKELLNGK